ncbi:dynamin family protein [Parageobacillus thermoglucosidasius]|uniref:GTPase n=1 Tax=Parageobacillus thermoglucosidasius TaxID=1426 RepID=A0AAN0YN07_PARTM|nr:dynamin family protein [Parageobacillus thermoglucosidasius]ALF10090.1 GTPase [Parageobacillus thermoglucosidasius]ANZ30172.1 GTPase [Parageobacillus thermoglucosidasius]APM80909.1 GTPase [Parageobacillus thermoglucosidasius]KJX70625.1 GTPase [Parageobacillus thermoglucosidasius]MED4904436.1 dynamin family protein [Parageobacillus thermoglucosidasius]
MQVVEDNVRIQREDSLEYYKIICSFPYQNHPIFYENDSVRKAYIKLLHHYAKKDVHYQKYYKPIITLYEHCFNIEEEEICKEQTSQSSLKLAKEIRKTRWKLEKAKLYVYNYKYMFFAHYLLLIYGYVSMDHPCVLDVTYKHNLKINYKDAETIVRFINALKAGDFEAAKSYLNLKKFHYLRFYYDAYKKQVEFLKDVEKRYLIVGTMSSGKSTFLNSLIGQEIFPSQNEACTSKVFTYAHRPYIKHFIVQHDQSEFFDCLIDGVESTMNELNENPLIEHVYVEGKMSDIFQVESRVVFIDTPGTNNSMNRSHEDITFKAIQSEQYDAIFYLINATQLGTDDDRRLLSYVKEHIENNSDKQVVFIVNKADEIDEEANESLQGLLESTKTYLKQNGFEKPSIILLSAYVGNLCQKVLKGEDLTRREQNQFDFFYDYFAEETQDLTKYATIPCAFQAEVPNDQREVKIKNKTYDIKRIYTVLQQSGIYQIKNYM